MRTIARSSTEVQEYVFADLTTAVDLDQVPGPAGADLSTCFTDAFRLHDLDRQQQQTATDPRGPALHQLKRLGDDRYDRRRRDFQ